MHKIESKYALYFCQGQEYQTLFKSLKIKTKNTFIWNGWFKEKKSIWSNTISPGPCIPHSDKISLYFLPKHSTKCLQLPSYYQQKMSPSILVALQLSLPN